jgi:hypothetical protein
MSAIKTFEISNRISVFAGVNYTEHKETVDTYTNSDTGIGYRYGLSYRIAPNYSIKLSYDDYYSKNTSYVGKEETQSIGVSLALSL